MVTIHVIGHLFGHDSKATYLLHKYGGQEYGSLYYLEILFTETLVLMEV